MKQILFKTAMLLMTHGASAAMVATATCRGGQVTLTLDSTGGLFEIGQTLRVQALNAEPTFGFAEAIQYLIEQTASGVFCVDHQPWLTHVLALSKGGSKCVALIEQKLATNCGLEI